MHNHNDLGHFAIAYDNTDIAIDAGTGVYSKDNFSDKRYTLWYNNAGSHNAPVLDGVMQEFGAEYTSTLTMESDADGSYTLVCDLGKAYPAAAGVKAFVRRSTVAAEGVTIHDRIEWQGREVVINLLCLGKPEKCRGGLLLGGKVLLRSEGIEVREICLQEEKFTNWPAPIYKVVLATSASEYKLCFSSAEK
jgi:hypothetical protein